MRVTFTRELHFNSSLSHFFINESSTSEQRTVIVENRFDSPVLVHEIVFPDEAKPYFKLTFNEPDLKMPLLLPKGKPFPLLNLEFTPSPQLSHFSTVFRLMTNFSYFDLPLFAYRGRLDLVRKHLHIYPLTNFHSWYSLFPTHRTKLVWTLVWLG